MICGRLLATIVVGGGLAVAAPRTLYRTEFEPMATTLTIRADLSFEGNYYETGQLAPGIERLKKLFSVVYTNGTGTNQATVLFAENYAGSTPTLNLQALTDFLGQSRNLAKVTAIAFINNDTANTLSLTGNFLTRLSGVSVGTESMFVLPGGANVFFAPTTGFKYAVDGTHAVIATDVSTNFDIIILGET